MFVKPDNWNELSPLERRKLRLDSWQNKPVQFVSPEAEANYKTRIGRLRKAYDVEFSDRIVADISMGVGEFAMRREGVTGADMNYDHAKMRQPLLNFHKEFQPDTAIGPLPYPGKSWDILDFKLYQWGGNQLPDNLVIQAVEGEYMMASEYKDFIKDPTAFFLKKFLPRTYGALAPMAMLPDFPRIVENVDTINLLVPFAMPEFQEMLQKMSEAAGVLMGVLGEVGQTSGMIQAEGFPSMGMNITKTPFDYLGDTLRGTKGILMDMFRNPDDLLAACEAYVPILVDSLINLSDMNDSPTVMYVLHKGADSFMSQAQFEKFYWPTWKAVMDACYEEGIISNLFVEGSYNNRLENLAQLPDKSVHCMFDQTDMKKVKEVLGGKFTISGNIPASLMSTGSPEEVRAYCDNLVDLYSDTPGYILSFGCGFEMTTEENVRAVQESVLK